MANEVLSATPQKIKRSVCRAMFAAAVLLRARFDKIWQQISRYAPPQASQIGIAVTECGPLFFPMPIERFFFAFLAIFRARDAAEGHSEHPINSRRGLPLCC